MTCLLMMPLCETLLENHHLTLKVTSIESARMRADELGFRVVGDTIADPTWSELFLHPASTHGVLIQFAEFEDTKRT